jgi:hypothetical protein
VSARLLPGRLGPSLTIALAVFLGASTAHAAATYYVSPNGSDSNRGSESAPFRHLTKAAASARNPGDTVIVMNGTYDNEGVVAPDFVVTLRYSGSAGNPITFMAQNRGQAILDAMNTSSTSRCNGAASYLDLRNASHVVIQGFVIQRACDSGIQSNDNAHDITIRWNEIRNIANRTVTDQIGRDGIYLNAHEYNFTFDGNIFHDIGRTDGQANLHFDHGIYARAQSLTIINNVFYNMNRGWSIQLAEGASRWLIANNTFAFDNANGEGGQIIFWGTNSDIAIQNNIFYVPKGSAVNRFGATVSGCTFDHNLIYGASRPMTGSTSGIFIGDNQIVAQPSAGLFVNATTAPYDFHLRAGSPAIGYGAVVSSVRDDLEGRPRARSSWDVGAYASSTDGDSKPGERSRAQVPPSAQR